MLRVWVQGGASVVTLNRSNWPGTLIGCSFSFTPNYSLREAWHCTGRGQQSRPVARVISRRPNHLLPPWHCLCLTHSVDMAIDPFSLPYPFRLTRGWPWHRAHGQACRAVQPAALKCQLADRTFRNYHTRRLPV